MTRSSNHEHNKRMGSYYTPQNVARRIVTETLERWIMKKSSVDLDSPSNVQKNILIERLNGIRILDPAVGDGVFLVEAGNQLLSLRKEFGETKDARRIRKEIVTQNLFGVDIQLEAVEECKKNLLRWAGINNDSHRFLDRMKILCGNSLIGNVNQVEMEYSSENVNLFHWIHAFPKVFQSQKGFDIIIGNPPYGNLLNRQEKEEILATLSFDVMTGKNGSWNTAPIFIVRSKELLNPQGLLGLLLPNSLLRVGQFRKAREFIRNELGIWKIIDEGNPFENVTLEMVSIFGEKDSTVRPPFISIESRRRGLETLNQIPREVTENGIISLYHDPLFSRIKKQGKTHVITASRGRDIPSEYTSKYPSRDHVIPYATKGRSVRRYHIDDTYLTYTTDWFKDDEVLLDSFSNEFLVATKNYPYPRCVMKPKRIVHGGGVVRIRALLDDLDMKAVGFILNSKLIRFVSTRYLTNYSKLTTCMNTGIMKEIPIKLPQDSRSFTYLFETLQRVHEDGRSNGFKEIDVFCNALLYSHYLDPDNEYASEISVVAESLIQKSPTRILEIVKQPEIHRLINQIMNQSDVQWIENSPRME